MNEFTEVHSCEFFNGAIGEFERAKFQRTPDWIAKLPDGRIVPGTGRHVPSSDLDGQGRYVPGNP
jgi:ATP-dependent exoDNAse (exonuclease V) alpha subunit